MKFIVYKLLNGVTYFREWYYSLWRKTSNKSKNDNMSSF